MFGLALTKACAQGLSASQVQELCGRLQESKSLYMCVFVRAPPCNVCLC